MWDISTNRWVCSECGGNEICNLDNIKEGESVKCIVAHSPVFNDWVAIQSPTKVTIGVCIDLLPGKGDFLTKPERLFIDCIKELVQKYGFGHEAVHVSIDCEYLKMFKDLVERAPHNCRSIEAEEKLPF